MRRRGRHVVTAVIGAWILTVALFVAPSAAQLIEPDAPRPGADGEAPGCWLVENQRGFSLTYVPGGDEAFDGDRLVFDRLVFERRVRDLREGPADDEARADWFWRGRIDVADFARTAGEPSFVDGPAPDGFAVEAHRVRVLRNGRTVSTLPCVSPGSTEGPLTCTVEFAATGGYVVRWTGEATAIDADGAAAEFIVERDVNDEDVFYWRGRVVGTLFEDEPSTMLPMYRVSVRLGQQAGEAITGESATCELDLGPIGTPRLTAFGPMVCPAPGSSFVDTWGAPRDGGARRHQGVDMFAERGAPVLAPVSGRLEFGFGQLGGKVFRLEGDDGRYYYGAHLDAFVGVNRWVVAGEPVGTVGTTGNARTTPPHLHFQIHPNGRGTPPVNPTQATLQACSGG